MKPSSSYTLAIDTRKTILRVLLGALALAAAAGVMAVFIDARWVTFRVMWTGVITAVASGITLPLARMLDRKRTRPAGLFGLSWLVVEFLAVVVLVWLEPTLPIRVFEELGITALMLLITGVPAFIGLVLMAYPWARLAGRVIIGVSIATFAILLVTIWWPGRFYNDDEGWLTAWSVGGMGVLAALTLVGFETTRRWWRWVGIAVGVVALLLALMEIWGSRVMPDEFLSVPICLAALIAYANVIFLIPLRPGQRWLPWAIFGAATVTMITFDLLVITDFGFAEEPLARISIAGAIVAGCGTMAIAILAIFNRRGEVEAESSEFMRLPIACPRCRHAQDAPIGKSTCVGCGLRFDLRVEEPRCVECGYLLWGITADKCPECGTMLAAAPT